MTPTCRTGWLMQRVGLYTTMEGTTNDCCLDHQSEVILVFFLKRKNQKLPLCCYEGSNLAPHGSCKVGYWAGPMWMPLMS